MKRTKQIIILIFLALLVFTPISSMSTKHKKDQHKKKTAKYRVKQKNQKKSHDKHKQKHQKKQNKKNLRVQSAKINFTRIKIKFNRPMDISSLTQDSLYLLGENGKLSHTLSWDKHNKKLTVNLPDNMEALCKPLLLVMTPNVKDTNGGSLQQGFIKGFNMWLNPQNRSKASHKGPFKNKHTLFTDPLLTIHHHLFFLNPFKLKFKYHHQDDGDDHDDKKPGDRHKWEKLKKLLGKKHKEKFELLKKKSHKKKGFSYKSRSGLLNCFKKWFHFPAITVDGLPADGTAVEDVTPLINVTDEDDDLWFYHALLDFEPYQPGTAITQNGEHWLLVVAVDKWYKTSVKLFHFTLNKAPEFTTLTPNTSYRTNTQQLTLSGQLQSAVSLTINGTDQPLDNGLFSKSVTLNAGDNVFTLSAENMYGKTTVKTFYRYLYTGLSGPGRGGNLSGGKQLF